MASNEIATEKNKAYQWMERFSAKASEAARSPKWHRRLALTIGSIIGLWLVAWLAVPPILKSQLEKIASEKLGRQVTVGSVDFKPWSLELTLNELSIAKAVPQQIPQLKIRRIYIDAEIVSLLRLAPVVDAVEVDEPVVSLLHEGGGRYDIDDILERFKPAPSQPAGEPLKFALYNLVLRGGSIDYADKTVQRTHQLRDLELSVPFLSNLQSKREIRTTPHLAFKLNGSRFDTAAEGTPFAQTRKTDAVIKLTGFDLGPYLGYLPSSLPFRLQSAVVNADVKVAFEQTPDTVVKVSGLVTVDKVRLADRAGKPAAGGTDDHELLAFDQLRVMMEDVRPLERSVKLSGVDLSAPVLSITRDKAGRLDLMPESAQVIQADQATASAGAPSAPASSAVVLATVPKSSAWKVQVSRVAVKDGAINWLDQTLPSPAQIRLAGMSLDASAIAVPFAVDAPLRFNGSVGLDASTLLVKQSSQRTPPAAAAPALLAFSGAATDQSAQITATLSSWPLNMAAKYVGQFLLPALGGQLDAQLGINWQAATADRPQALQVTAPQLSLSDIRLAQGKVSLVSVRRVDLAGVDIDVTAQNFKAARMQLTNPAALVERDADKRWMFERWMVGKTNGATGSSVPAEPDAKTRAAPSWAVAINELQLDGGSMSFSDKAGAKPVAFEMSGAKAQLTGLVLDEKTSGKAAAAKLLPLNASLRLSAGRFEPGNVSFKGSVGLAPVQAQGQLLVDRLPVQAFEPYFAEILNIELLRADANFKGKVAYKQTPAGAVAQVSGDVGLEELKANTLAPSEELLAWKALNLRGLNVSLDPAKATRVDVRETVLTDFFARVIVMPNGRINLQDLLRQPGESSVASTASPTAATVATVKRGTATVAIAPTVARPASTATAALTPVINFGPVSLINGKVLFSDRFVKPNYSADLSDLTGKLSAFSSVAAVGTPSMADLELRGRAEGTASLEILGKLNPLAKPLALDINGKVRDLELPPLSPYSIKYSGYGINRGKLSVDVNYVVLPDGRLTASNKVILNQLDFGDKVAGSTASLPVKLAVALLADRNGVIDIDLPISGSLNDPQFSLGPIIVKVIINVIVKAITAPFSLLASAFGGGGDELSTVAFATGSAQLGPDAKSGLDKVAKALTDRPSLKLTVVGTSSVEAERDGFKRERLDELVRAEKRRSTVKNGGTTSAVVTVGADEYPLLLKEVYKRADMPKPRNLVGMAKDLPVDEMEKLLLADVKVGDDAMRELAVQRGVAVKDYLASRGLPPERLFLGAAKAVPPEAKWTPRAELNLASS